MVLSAMKNNIVGSEEGGARAEAICELRTEKVIVGQGSISGDRFSQEGGIWRRNIPGRRKSTCKGPAVGVCLGH